MIRDASLHTSDLKTVDSLGMDAFCLETVHRYRQQLAVVRPGHVWEKLGDMDFLLRIQAAAIGKDSAKHPTSAGLLMFGWEPQIRQEFTSYALDYQEKNQPAAQAEDPSQRRDPVPTNVPAPPAIFQICSSSGDWSGNVYDFYTRVYHRLTRDLPLSDGLSKTLPTGQPPVCRALREALINCLVNADYYSRQGVTIFKRQNQISLSNPGSFRVEMEAAKGGGISDPRNSTLLQMFHLIDAGKRNGSGLPNIFSVWNQEGWKEPVIEEEFGPERITLSLQLGQVGAPCQATSRLNIPGTDLPSRKSSEDQKQAIAEHLTDHVSASCRELAAILKVSASRTRQLLRDLIQTEAVVPEGNGKRRRYRLKT